MTLDVCMLRVADIHACTTCCHVHFLQARLVCVIPTSTLKPMDGTVSRCRRLCMHKIVSASVLADSANN
jgi:hypothetical protein